MKRKILLFVAALLCISTVSTAGDVVPQELIVVDNPKVTGFNLSRLERVDTLMDGYVKDGKMVNGVLMLGHNGQIIFSKAYGWKDREKNELLKEDDIFRIASMTKSIVSVALMTLYEEGRFLLDDPLWWYIPQFKEMEVIDDLRSDGTYTTRPARKHITIRHLLSHSSGIPYETAYNSNSGLSFTSTMDDITIGELIIKLADMPLAHEPGEKFTYGMNTDVIGYLIELLSDQPLDEFLKERIFDRIGMDDTYFYLPKNKKGRLVKLYSWNREKSEFETSTNEVQQNFAISGPQKCFLGGAGLCSTAMDYAKFCQMLLNKGIYNGQRILGTKTVELMSKRNQLAENAKPSYDFMFDLGFEIHSPSNSTHALIQEGAYGWSGMYGTYYRIDPVNGLFIVFMSNEHPWPDRERIKEFIQIAVYQAME